MREGKLDQKHLLFGEDGSPNNYDLNMGHTGGGGWRTPRHRHNFDQIRYVISGRLPYSETDFSRKAGWGTSPRASTTAPRSAPRAFGPWFCRAAARAAPGYLSVAQREATNAELNKTGEFKKGLYHYTDAQRRSPDRWMAPRRSSSTPRAASSSSRPRDTPMSSR